MSAITSIKTLCEAAFTGGTAFAQQLADQELSRQEEELLAAAAKDGQFRVIRFPGLGIAVHAGGHTFEDADPAVAARYFESFRRLCERGLILHDSEELFLLTGTGFDLGRKLNSRNGQDLDPNPSVPHPSPPPTLGEGKGGGSPTTSLPHVSPPH